MGSDLSTGPDALSVLIVDDHAVVRRGVRALLEAQPEFRVVAEASDVPAALEAVQTHRPALVVLDIHMPGEPGLSAPLPRSRAWSR